MLAVSCVAERSQRRTGTCPLALTSWRSLETGASTVWGSEGGPGARNDAVFGDGMSER